MTDITPFRFPEDGRDIRVLTIDGEPWFVASDVATALGYANPRDAVARLVDDEDKGVGNHDTPGGVQSLSIVNESGLYALIFGSKLPAAKAFKRWVTAEVLPALRRTGTYAAEPVAAPADDLAVVEHIVAAIRADRERMTAIEARQDVIEARVSAAGGEYDEFSALAYAKLNDLPTDRVYLSRLGRAASRIFRERYDREPRARQDATFGLLNIYPAEVLAAAAERVAP